MFDKTTKTFTIPEGKKKIDKNVFIKVFSLELMILELKMS